MKIFLANPSYRIDIGGGKERYFVRAGSRWPFSTVKKINNKPEYIPFPFFLAYTAAILQKKGHTVIIDDGVAVNETEDQLLENITKERPQVLFFESTTPTIDYDIKLAEKIKKISSKIIICLAGTHVSVFPEQILTQNPVFDFLFLAEYEINFSEFIDCLSQKINFDKVGGMAFKKNNKVVINKVKAIENLDVLPFPARHLFPLNNKSNPSVYWDGFCQYQPSMQMQASRGCPFKCNFCLWNQVLYQNGKYRMFSPERIVDEMEEVFKKYGAREIYFDDDTFTADKKQVLAICDEINNRGIRVNWSVMGDAMVSDEEMVVAMAEAGCIGIKIGVESGSQEILRKIGKPINFGKVKKFCRWCSENKIKTHATFTFGLSGETKQTMKQTLDFAKSLDVDSVQFSLTTPFPGTRYFDQLKKENRLTSQNWKDFDGSSSSVVMFENISPDYLVEFCLKASGRWLISKIKDPSWLKRQIYNLIRQAKGQGLFFVVKRFKRGLDLIFDR